MTKAEIADQLESLDRYDPYTEIDSEDDWTPSMEQVEDGHYVRWNDILHLLESVSDKVSTN